MNDDDMLTAVRNRLTEVRDGLGDVHMDTPASEILVRAQRHRTRRRLSVALACGTVAVTAVAVIAATGGAAQPGTSGVTNAQTTAYVIKRVDNALAAANFVIQARESGTTTSSVHGHRVSFGDGLTLSWAYSNRNRTEQFTGSGCGHALPDGSCTHRGGSEPYWADGTALIGGRLIGAYVTYYDHKYSLSPLGHYHLKACSATAQLVLAGGQVTMPNWPTFIKAMLGCGTATVTGHARIGGVETTVISGSVDVPLSKGYARAVKEKRVRVRYTLYVDSASYLPVRAAGSTESYGGAGGPTIVANVTDVQWLRPTPANLATALVTIPPGYQLWKGPSTNQ
jgi:hypothetical protein